jgi:hypothetical protein
LGLANFFAKRGETKMKLDLNKTNGSSPPDPVIRESRFLQTPVQQKEEIWTVTEVANYLKMFPRQVWELTRRRDTSTLINIRAWFDRAFEQNGGRATCGAVVEVNGRIVSERSGHIGSGEQTPMRELSIPLMTEFALLLEQEASNG